MVRRRMSASAADVIRRAFVAKIERRAKNFRARLEMNIILDWCWFSVWDSLLVGDFQSDSTDGNINEMSMVEPLLM